MTTITIRSRELPAKLQEIHASGGFVARMEVSRDSYKLHIHQPEQPTEKDTNEQHRIAEN